MSFRSHEIAIIIPALNEENSIGHVIEKIPVPSKIFVVDNGSNDTTAEIAIDGGATVIFEPRRGYGYACQAGIRAVLKLDPHPKYVVFLDADSADEPSFITKFVDLFHSDSSITMVMGQRLDNLGPSAMLPHAIVANKLIINFINVLYRTRLTDMGPFRMIRFEDLIQLGMRDTGYGWSSEMIVRVLKKGYKIGQVPVTYRKQIGKSKIGGSFSTSLKAAIWLILHILRVTFFTRGD